MRLVSQRQKWIAMLSCICFTLTSVAMPANLNASAIISGVPQSNEVHFQGAEGWISMGRELPSELGRIAESFIPLSDASIYSQETTSDQSYPFVIHLQDAHSHPEAQSRIFEILNWLDSLHQTYGVNSPFVVAFEGSVGKIHPEYLDLFPQFEDANQEFVEDLHKKGELSGVELYAWEKYLQYKGAGPEALSKVIFFGAEDKKSYSENLKLYRDLVFKKDEIQRLMHPWNAQLEIAQSRFLNPELRDFIRDSEREEILSHLLLSQIKKTLNIDLNDRVEQIRFPNLSRIAYLREMSTLIDDELAHLEWNQWKAVLQLLKVPAEEVQFFQAFMEESTDTVVSLRKTFESLYQRFSPEELKLRDYPHLSQWFAYHLLSQEIDSQSYAKEVEAVRETVMSQLAKTDQEKEFVGIYQDFLLLRKILSGNLTRDEYDNFEKRKNKINIEAITTRLYDLLQDESGLSRFFTEANHKKNSLEKILSTSYEFYKGAIARDQQLLDNALDFYAEKKKQHGISQMQAGGILVLVSGGFHTDGLQKLLKSKDVGHMVITPRISTFSKENLYENVMRNKNSDLSDYFDNAPANKQEALILRGLVEHAAAKLTEYYSIDSLDVPSWIDQVIERHPVLQQKFESAVIKENQKQIARVTIKTNSENEVKTTLNQAVSEVLLLTDAELYPFLSESVGRISLLSGSKDTFGFADLLSTPSGVPQLKGEKALGRGVLQQVAMGGVSGLSEPEQNLLKRLTKSGLANGLLGAGVASNHRRLRRKRPPVVNQNEIPASRAELREEEKSKVGIISLDTMQPKQDLIDQIIRDNDVIQIVADAHEDDTYEAYIAKFKEYIDRIGTGLKNYRSSNLAHKEKHKVFVFKTWTGVGSTEKFFQDIKFFRQPTAEEGNNDFFFDVVFQPDFSYLDENDLLNSGQTVFGIRKLQKNLSPKEISENLEWQRQNRTKQLLQSTFETKGDMQFVSDLSAEQSKNDLIIYLAAKLAHFNDLAKVSRFYGADLSAVVYGAGLDKRIDKFFTNASLGFGGRLRKLVDWIEEEHIERILPALESQTDFFPHNIRRGAAEVKKAYVRERVQKAILGLREIAEKQNSTLTIYDILENLPRELHYLFLLENIKNVNRQNIKDFTERIVSHAKNNQAKIKSVAIIGASYRISEGRITKSPILNIISDLVKNTEVTEFYIADPKARQYMQAWLKSKKEDPQELERDTLGKLILERRIVFYGVDEGTSDLSILEAASKADMTIIATEGNPELKKLDRKKLDDFLKSLGDKPLFDAVNLFGLRANGKEIYSFQALEENHINYASVGRPGLGIFKQNQQLLHSHVIGESLVKGDVASETAALLELQALILSLETDAQRKESLTEQFANESAQKEGALASVLMKKKIGVVGGGYVGLTTGANLADLGHDVTVIDIPQKKADMDALQSDETKVPIHEPGLQDLIISGKQAGNLRFTAGKDEFKEGIENVSIVYLAVGTPQQDNGAQDPTYILNASRDIARVIKDQGSSFDSEVAFKTIVIKSTVTPQVFRDVVRALKEDFDLNVGEHYGLVSNPEFLREGQAIKDITVDLDRTVLGFYSEMSLEHRNRVEKDILELWYPLALRTPHTILITDTATSTLIKYAANAFLAVSISMANVFATSAELVGSLYSEIANLLRRDPRIGRHAFLACGPGYGGSCFPKDVRALNYLSYEKVRRSVKLGGSLEMIIFADQMNQYAKTANIHVLTRLLANNDQISDRAALEGKSIGIWGMAFKADTDDMRESQTAHFLSGLLKIGAEGFRVRLDDPIFRVADAPERDVIIDRFLDEVAKHYLEDENFKASYARDVVANSKSPKEYFKKSYFPQKFLKTGMVTFADDANDALSFEGKNVDALVVMTDWREYKERYSELLQDGYLAHALRGAILLDTRAMLSYEDSQRVAEEAGISVAAPGRKDSLRRNELREVSDQLMTSMQQMQLSSEYNTEQFRRLFASLIVGDYQLSDLESLLAKHPELKGIDAVIQEMTSGFYAEDIFKDVSILVAVRYIQLLTTETVDNHNMIYAAVELSREVLGPWAWILDDSDTLIDIISILKPSLSPLQLFRITATFAAASRSNNFSFVIENGSPQDARDYAAMLVDEMIALKLPAEQLLDRFRFISASSDDRSMNRAIMQLYSQDKDKYVAAVTDSKNFLEKLGYAPRLTRVHHDEVNLDVAVLITAALLRKLEDTYQIISAEGLGTQFGLDVNGLVERVAQMMAVLEHLATQA